MIVQPLFSGSSGNATYVEHGSTRILVDCGGSGKQIENALRAIGVDARQLTAIVVTHAHDDHIRGVGVLSRRFDLPVYASIGAWDEMTRRNKIGSVKTKNIRVFQSEKSTEELDLGDLSAKYFPTPHDADDSVGYVFSDGRATFGFATDVGCVTARLRDALLGVDAALLEANYDEKMLWGGPYPEDLKARIASKTGHLCNVDAGKFAVELVKNGAKTLILGHLSEHNNTPMIALCTASDVLVDDGIRPQEDCVVEVARRYEPSCRLEL